MARERSQAAGTGARTTDNGLLVSGIVGGLAGLVLGYLIPVVGLVGGGIVAGYLRQGTGGDGARAGAVSGVVGAVPGLLGLLLFGLLFAPFLLAIPLSFLGAGEAAGVAGGILGLVVTVVLGLLAVVASLAIPAALGGAGGFLGSELAAD